MYQRSSYLLGFGWEAFTRMDRKAKITEHAVLGLERAFVKWLGPQGALTRNAATDLVKHFKKCIDDQVDVEQFAELTDRWKNYKEAKGLLRGKAQATGRLKNSIKALNQGSGHYAVGVPRHNAPYIRHLGMTNFPGKFGQTKIPKTHKFFPGYAEIFEFGSSKQKPRPVFSHWFQLWIEKNVPTLIEPFKKEFQIHFDVIKEQWTGESAEEIFSTSTRIDFEQSGLERTLTSDAEGSRNLDEFIIQQHQEEITPEGFYSDEDDLDAFADKEVWEETIKENLFKKYELLLQKVNNQLLGSGITATRTELESMHFWNPMMTELYKKDTKLWETVSALYLKLVDLQEQLGIR